MPEWDLQCGSVWSDSCPNGWTFYYDLSVDDRHDIGAAGIAKSVECALIQKGTCAKKKPPPPREFILPEKCYSIPYMIGFMKQYGSHYTTEDKLAGPVDNSNRLLSDIAEQLRRKGYVDSPYKYTYCNYARGNDEHYVMADRDPLFQLRFGYPWPATDDSGLVNWHNTTFTLYWKPHDAAMTVIPAPKCNDHPGDWYNPKDGWCYPADDGGKDNGGGDHPKYKPIYTLITPQQSNDHARDKDHLDHYWDDLLAEWHLSIIRLEGLAAVGAITAFMSPAAMRLVYTPSVMALTYVGFWLYDFWTVEGANDTVKVQEWWQYMVAEITKAIQGGTEWLDPSNAKGIFVWGTGVSVAAAYAAYLLLPTGTELAGSSAWLGVLLFGLIITGVWELVHWIANSPIGKAAGWVSDALDWLGV